MKMISIIGIRGMGPGTGKDTATQIILELLRERGLRFEHAKFATPIRQVMETLLGLSVQETESTEGKNKVIPKVMFTTGQCLQMLGSSLRETLYQGVIADALFRNIGDKPVVISDVRMKVEQNAIKERGGVVILVDSNRIITAEAMAGRSVSHETERDLDGVPPDYVVKNEGTVEELRDNIRKVLDTIFGVQAESVVRNIMDKEQLMHYISTDSDE
jgi:dephospho-CoA kinase